MTQNMNDDIALGDGPTQLTREADHETGTEEASRCKRYGRIVKPTARFGRQVP